MHLKSIELKNFRSYHHRRFSFESPGCILLGSNGSGKTNLLEAIAYTSIGKSIRYQSEAELLSFGTGFFSLSADYDSSAGVDLHVFLSYAEKRKLLKIDGQISRHLSTLFSLVKTIYCAPEDIMLINGSPRLRRQYFDLAISQLWPEYLAVLREYLHIVDQRNNLLKREYQRSEKAGWDQNFARSYLTVLSYRKRYLQLLNNQFNGIFEVCDDTIHDVAVDYLWVGKDIESFGTEELSRHLNDLEPREKVMQRSLIGAHIDDYHFRQGKRSLRAYTSQGQKRLTVILLKLIQARLIEQETRILPIILYDDILAELDTRYSARIKELTDSRFQVFIASPNHDVTKIWDHMPQVEMEALACE